MEKKKVLNTRTRLFVCVQIQQMYTVGAGVRRRKGLSRVRRRDRVYRIDRTGRKKVRRICRVTTFMCYCLSSVHGRRCLPQTYPSPGIVRVPVAR